MLYILPKKPVIDKPRIVGFCFHYGNKVKCVNANFYINCRRHKSHWTCSNLPFVGSGPMK